MFTTLKYNVLSYYHLLKGKVYDIRQEAESLKIFLAKEDSKKTGKPIEITTKHFIATYFPCGCRIMLWNRERYDNNSPGNFRCWDHRIEPSDTVYKGWSTSYKRREKCQLDAKSK